MLTWKFSFLTCDHCFIKLTLLLAEFNVFNQSFFFFFCLYLFFTCVFNILSLPQWLCIHTYGKLIFSIPATLTILVCEEQLKPISFDHQKAFLQCTKEKNERVWYNAEYLFSSVCSSHAPESVFFVAFPVEDLGHAAGNRLLILLCL